MYPEENNEPTTNKQESKASQGTTLDEAALWGGLCRPHIPCPHPCPSRPALSFHPSFFFFRSSKVCFQASRFYSQWILSNSMSIQGCLFGARHTTCNSQGFTALIHLRSPPAPIIHCPFPKGPSPLRENVPGSTLRGPSPLRGFFSPRFYFPAKDRVIASSSS